MTTSVVDIKCKICNKIFKDYKSNYKKFCSKKCYYLSKKGCIPWNKGTKGIMKAWNKGLKGFLAGSKHPWMPKGEKHYNWRGGISTKGYPYEWKEKLLDYIRERDSLVCQECGIHQDELDFGQVKKLDIHHIDYNKNNCCPENLISLCRSCHVKTNVNREYWIEYFNN